MLTTNKDEYCPNQISVNLVPPGRHTERRLEKYPFEDEYLDIWSEVNRTGTLTGGLVGFIVGVVLTGGLIYLTAVMG